MNRSVRAYRSSATDGATHLDVLLACYDALAGDIRFAGESAAKGDVVGRCRHSQRGLLLLGHLESWIPLLDESDLRASLEGFYAYLRSEILRLQVSTDVDSFKNLALIVCETRAVWQSKQGLGVSRSESAALATHPSEERDDAASRFLVSV